MNTVETFLFEGWEDGANIREEERINGCLLESLWQVPVILVYHNISLTLYQDFGFILKILIVFFKHSFIRSVLEFDADGFFDISFLFEWNDFFFILYSKSKIIKPEIKSSRHVEPYALIQFESPSNANLL